MHEKLFTKRGDANLAAQQIVRNFQLFGLFQQRDDALRKILAPERAIPAEDGLQ